MSEMSAEQPDPKLLRPFLRLGKYLDEDFLRRAEGWLFLVSGYGIGKTPVKPATKEEWLAFFAHCHDGWKQAQTEVAAFLIAALGRHTQAQVNEKEQHRLRDKAGQKQARAVLRQISLEIAISRRMLDVILWTIFAGDHSTLRRLNIEGGQHSLSATNIDEAMRTADGLNSNPLVMALSTDMLSLVHVGDLIVTNRETGSTTFVELKAGDKNASIAVLAEMSVRADCEVFEKLATAEFDETDKSHYARVKRQAVRNETIMSTIRNEGGIDPNTGNQVVIHATPEPVAYWSERIQRCYDSLTDEKKWAIDVVDECVYVGVYSDQQAAYVGFNAWMRIQRCDSQVFSLTDSFHDLGTRPLGATFLSLELRQKVLRGEILVIMCVDIQKLIELGNSMQQGFMRLATRAESAKMRDRRMGNFALNGRHICTTIDGELAYLGAGTRDRILFDHQHPAQLLAQRLVAGPISQYARPRRD
jgi:hypothetical protein